MGRPSL